MKMERVMVQLPATVKTKLDGLRHQGTSISGYIRYLLERERDFRRNSARWFTIGPALNGIALTLVYISSPVFHGTQVQVALIAADLVTTVTVLTHLARKFAADARRYQSELDEV